jgi:hypothetical protein
MPLSIPYTVFGKMEENFVQKKKEKLNAMAKKCFISN